MLIVTSIGLPRERFLSLPKQKENPSDNDKRPLGGEEGMLTACSNRRVWDESDRRGWLYARHRHTDQCCAELQAPSTFNRNRPAAHRQVSVHSETLYRCNWLLHAPEILIWRRGTGLAGAIRRRPQ